MEHCIDIDEGTVNVGSNGSNDIVQKLNEDLSGLPILDLKCCIYRVSEGLCKAKREAYEPMVVSIGPYHLKNPKLKAMKKHKLRYLHLLLERRKENVDRYVVELKKLEDRVRKCYVEPIDDLNGDDFVEMMLLDACFIIEFFREKSLNDILDVDCMDAQICRDLMLLENQLPFFLLSHFYDMTKNPDCNPNTGPGDPDHDPDDVPEHPKPDPDNNSNNGLLRLVLSSFSSIIPSPCLKYCLEDPDHDLDNPKPDPDNDSEDLDPDELSLPELAISTLSCNIPPPCLKYCDDHLDQTHDPREIKHLLHLVHVLCGPLHKQKANLKSRNTKKEKFKQEDILNAMHSAVELEDAGVKFKVIGQYYNDTAHLFDIDFNNGLMDVPCFSVDHRADTFFRNLIAFEQHSMDIVTKYFTEYADFMDQLISSKKDVKLLRDEGIIVNYLGDDKEVTNLFNNLCDGVEVSYPTSYVDVRKKANKYRNQRWNKMRAKLCHDYFNSPWAGISTFGAITLLVLTLLQTLESFENKQ